MKTLLLLRLSLMGTCSVLTSSVAISNGSNNISPLPPEPPRPSVERPQMVAFKPSTAVIVGLLTAIFSITFLALLYVKHCKTRNVYDANSSSRVPPSSSAARKNSGVNRAVIDSLPVFRFSSLRGEKEGLGCAVCLNRFEPNEVLRLLPKCKHAFHVECVDTWLDAHSTCPLCRYRVDPEDVLLLCDAATAFSCRNEQKPPPFPPRCEENQVLESVRRVSGRHSSAGERGNGGGLLQIILNRHGDSSANHQNSGENNENPLISRRSLDSWNAKRKKKKKNEVSVGCFDRQPRKDELLSTSEEARRSSEQRRRLEHRIIIGEVGGGGAGGGGGGATVTRFSQRWSDVQPADLLYLQSEMIMSDGRRLSGTSSGSRPSVTGGRSVINGRSVSEMTGVSRFGNSQWQRRHLERWQKRGGVEEEDGEAGGLVSRWMVRISQYRHHHQSENATPHTPTLPFVRSESTVA